jgi:hypothetical protein
MPTHTHAHIYTTHTYIYTHTHTYIQVEDDGGGEVGKGREEGNNLEFAPVKVDVGCCRTCCCNGFLTSAI